jgi:hypothetical protein
MLRITVANSPPPRARDWPDRRGSHTANVHPRKGSAAVYIGRGQALHIQLANALRERGVSTLSLNRAKAIRKGDRHV